MNDLFRPIYTLVMHNNSMQDAVARHKWQVLAAKENKARIPSGDDIQDWEHHSKVESELHEFKSAINDIQTALNVPGSGAVHGTSTDEASILTRCKKVTHQRGACVVASHSGDV